MARRGARVIMACRNLDKAQKVADKIIKETGNEKVIVKKLDLASLASVRAFANDILRTERALHILFAIKSVSGVTPAGKKLYCTLHGQQKCGNTAHDPKYPHISDKGSTDTSFIWGSTVTAPPPLFGEAQLQHYLLYLGEDSYSTTSFIWGTVTAPPPLFGGQLQHHLLYLGDSYSTTSFIWGNAGLL
ncbi:NAD(P)-binding domain [Trinorchestia longiramus]|nr:NAD(P)-binding domain [Trinorchestia longiramus]